MNKYELQSNLNYLVNKYIWDEGLREQLKVQISNGKAKFLLAEIDRNKVMPYSDSDIELIKDISFFFC